MKALIFVTLILFVCCVHMSITRNVRIYRNGGENEAFETKVEINDREDTLNDLISDCINQLWKGEQDELLKYYSYFELKDENGKLIENTLNLREYQDLYFVPKGEHWVYPPKKVGNKLSYYDNYRKKNFTIETIYEKPGIFRIDNFLSEKEIDQIVNVTISRLEDSYVGPFSERKIINDRTSKTAWLKRKEHYFVGELDKRIFEIMNMPFYSEIDDSLQVVQYRENQQYTCHVDYFWKNNIYTNEDISYKNGVNRFLTFFFYAIDPEEGGETAFCNLIIKPDASPEEGYCGKFFKVKPKRGSAIFWYSLKPAFSSFTEKMMPNHDSLHAGCPVFKGYKMGSNKWIFNKHPPGHTLGDQSRFID